jgi:hypothetical protein
MGHLVAELFHVPQTVRPVLIGLPSSEYLQNSKVFTGKMVVLVILEKFVARMI